MTMVIAVASASLRELARRRVALLFIFLLPLALYTARLDVPWQALRMLALGVGWAIATLSLFVHVSARPLDQRLAAIGASPTALFLGRQLALIAVGLVLAGSYFAVAALNPDGVARIGGVGLLLVTTTLIGAPLGALVSLIITRELEGALALLTVMAVQLLIDPARPIAKLLPMWSTRELSTYAIEDDGQHALGSGLAHFAIAVTVCFVLAWAASMMRLRPVRIARPA
ncbi:hypothetical protein [Demequina lutea]|uniref:ABC-2 type transport system permease protein n=1 Tax=Demequina lutea TaxID=431489 RepID=A0A7Y9Z8V6_9MICO|nr:hypothetical protein [Demequina lutea]NYI40962.1 hypothetical protein [Demequina lutea]